MARTVKKKKELTFEEKLAEALVPVEEQPYRVPENWCWTKLRSISFHISDGSHNPPKNSGKGVPLLSATNIHDRIIDFEQTARWITEAEWTLENERTQIEVGDILLTIVATIGRVAVVTTEKPFALQRSVAAIKPKIDAQYLSYYFESPYIQTFMNTNAKGTAQKGFYLNSLENLFCALPPLPEQQRIVDRIESLFAKLDEAKEKAQAVVDGFEDRKAAILHKAFTGELTAEWRSENSVAFSDWKINVLDACFDIVSGIQKKPSRAPKNNPVPYITVANVYRNRIDLSDLRYFEVLEDELEKLQLKYADILIVEGNGSGNEIGRCAIWRDELPVCIHQNHIIRIRRKDDSVLPEYVLFYLNSSSGKHIMKERAKTTAGLYNLSTGKIKTIPVPFAPIKEQQEIVCILNKMLEMEQQAKETAEQVISQIDTMKKSILARAFRGELGTNDPTEESAVELLKTIL